MNLPVPGSRQAGRHDRFLPVADPQRQGSEAVPGQGPARPEALGKACHAQYRQSAELWCSDHRIEARRKAGPGRHHARHFRTIGFHCKAGRPGTEAQSQPNPLPRGVRTQQSAPGVGHAGKTGQGQQGQGG